MRTTQVHSCLLEIKSAGGAEFQPVVMNITLALIMLIGPELMWWPIISYFIHKFLQWLFGRDPHLSRIFFKYMREGDYYDPWPMAGQRMSRRPVNAGRDLLC